MHQKQISLILAICMLLVCSEAMAQQEKKPLTNNDIVTMLKAELTESTIILAVQQSSANFDTSPDALIQLKKQGASPKILDAVLQAQAKKLETKTPCPDSSSSSSPVPVNKVTESKVTINKEGERQNTRTDKIVENPVAKTIEGDFSFVIQSCKLSGQTVTCYIEITSLAEIDMIVWFRSDSQIIDDNGQPYNMTNVELGGKVASTNMGYTLIPKIPVKGLIRFKGVKPNISQIKLLRFSCLSDKRRNRPPSPVTIIDAPAYSPFEIDFRDIALSKEN